MKLPERMPSAPSDPKKCRGPAHVLEQEPNRQQIEKHAESPADSVMALAAQPVHVLDRHLADRRAVPARQRRDEPVHLAVERNVVDHLAPIGLERRAEVVNIHAGQLGHQPVGNARRNPAHDEVVDALLAPAGDNVVALLELLQEIGNLRRIVLQITIH